jgi:hypothetical protein
MTNQGEHMTNLTQVLIQKVGGKLFLNGEEICPGTIDVRLDGLTYRASEKVAVKKQAEPEPVVPPELEAHFRHFDALEQEPVEQSLNDAVFTVLEGFTLPHDVRKILEAAYYTTPPQQELKTIEQQIARALRLEGLSLLKTANGYQIMRLEPAQALKEKNT